MRRHGGLLLVLSALLGLTACDESLAPLGASQHGVMDGRLLGRWVYVPEEEQRKDCLACYDELEVSAFNEHEYYVELRSRKAYEPTGTDRYRVFSSAVDGRAFVNIQSLAASEPRRYILGSYDVQKDSTTLLLSLVRKLTEPAKESGDSRTLSRYVRQHMGEKDFFDPPIRFVRYKGGHP